MVQSNKEKKKFIWSGEMSMGEVSIREVSVGEVSGRGSVRRGCVRRGTVQTPHKRPLLCSFCNKYLS